LTIAEANDKVIQIETPVIMTKFRPSVLQTNYITIEYPEKVPSL
jgi:hypothetical protein